MKKQPKPVAFVVRKELQIITIPNPPLGRRALNDLLTCCAEAKRKKGETQQ